MSRALVLPTLLLCTLSPALAQTSAGKLSPADLKDDFAVLRHVFEQAHAGLYRYTPKEEMDAAYRHVEAKLVRRMGELEFFRTLVPLIDRIHDTHTTLRPSVATLSRLGTSAKVFPIDVRYVDGKALVERDLSTSSDVPIGAEIVSINGVPMAAITEKVLAVKSADGFNRVPKYEVANVNFWIEYYEMVDTAETFEVRTRDPKTRRIDGFTVRGVPVKTVQDGQFEVPHHDEMTLEFVGERKVALLSIPSFGDLALIGKLAEAFHTIHERKTETLIIDLRNNGGGYDELNTELLSYLVPHPFQLYRRLTFRAKDWSALKDTKFDPDDFWNTADLNRLPVEERSRLLKERSLAETLDDNCKKNPATGTHAPKEVDAFRGDLYVLCNGRSQSSGGEVPALLHFLGIGTLIGEEPNAAYQGTTAGIVPTLTLPHSGIRVSVPLIAYENAVLPGLYPGHGAPPQFVVGETLEDALQGRDTVLEFTLALIERRL